MARLAVLIVAYDSAPHAARLAQALNAQTRKPDEIWVLENASPKAPVTEADLPEGARLITSETNLGFAAGNNLLAQQTQADWLAFLNPDAFPEPDWIERLLAATERHPDVDLFGSTQLAADTPGVLDGVGDVWFGAGIPYRSGYGKAIPVPAEGEVFAPCAAASLVRRSVFEALGGYDEDYFCYVEDVDLGFRARLAGSRTIQLPDAKVHHVGYGSSGRRSEFATYHGARNRLWTWWKNTPGWLFWLTLPVHAGLTLLLGISALRFGLGRAYWRGIGDALRGASAINAKRRA
ncbi:unnamed protein product, partial [Ectocarpus fasciculatus]